jgi:hypothetical protein
MPPAADTARPGGQERTPRTRAPAPPPDLPDFSGRGAEIAYLLEWLTRKGTRAEGPRIAVLAGRGGIGKTALAVHFAHRSRIDHPDGQLFVDVRGVGPHPLRAAEALAGFLCALDIPGPAIPEDQGERKALFRSLLADRRVLIILDMPRTRHRSARCCPAVTNASSSSPAEGN